MSLTDIGPLPRTATSTMLPVHALRDWRTRASLVHRWLSDARMAHGRVTVYVQHRPCRSCRLQTVQAELHQLQPLVNLSNGQTVDVLALDSVYFLPMSTVHSITVEGGQA